VSSAPPDSAAVDVTIVVPTYNECERISELTHAVFASCEAHGVRLELVIVDDNSPDGTGQVADQLTRDHRVRVIHRAGKLGLGSAVVEGFAVASAPVVAWMPISAIRPR
jgi:dolichol-phosphate mannosyltransferase